MIQQVATTFVQIILPVLLIGGLGYALGRARPIDLAPVVGLTVSVLVPAVVFDSLARATLPRGVLARLTLHVALQLLSVGLVTTLAARLVGWRGSSRDALLMATLFPNAGNIGLPLSLFAFGAPGLAIAGGWFALLAISSNTVGIYIAARSHAGGRAALHRLLRLPVTYAVLAGLVLNLAGWPVPGPIAKASQLLASGSVAVLLLLVGLQLARLSPREEARGATLATGIRLLVAPVIAWLVGRLVGLEGTALAVSVLQASTPTAVTAALWSMEFGTRPSLVSATVVLSTVAGVVTLTLLLALLLG